MLDKTIEDVQDYYGEVLKSKDDLKTSACCPADAPPEYLRPYIKNVHDTVLSKFYGCGTPVPEAIQGCTILDLGCGTGRDAYILSQIVGEAGKVIGLDMTENQLAVANEHVDWHMEKFGYSKPNVEFKKGFIEDLRAAGIEDNSVDVVISNCVINLSPDKDAVFNEIYRVLKPGGELYFSDVFSGRRISAELQNDKVLRGECLGGAIYIEDFRRMMNKVGIADMRIVARTPLELHDAEVINKIGMIDFYSITYRGFKVELEDICEDYGQVAYYLGTIDQHLHSFTLDDHHTFFTGKPMLVCSNTANMLKDTRFAQHFRVEGDLSVHYGPFDCSAPETANSEQYSADGACC